MNNRSQFVEEFHSQLILNRNVIEKKNNKFVVLFSWPTTVSCHFDIHTGLPCNALIYPMGIFTCSRCTVNSHQWRGSQPAENLARWHRCGWCWTARRFCGLLYARLGLFPSICCLKHRNHQRHELQSKIPPASSFVLLQPWPLSLR